MLPKHDVIFVLNFSYGRNIIAILDVSAISAANVQQKLQ